MNRVWRVRPARSEDIPSLEKLITSVGGDMEDLKAEQFVAAESKIGGVVGCGRLKPYVGFCELASLAVWEEWRASGVGRGVVTELLKLHPGPIYLLCENDVVDFFRRFGFDLISTSEMLAGLQTKWERYIAQVGHINVMRRG